ncbi:MAG TPA: Ca2+-dependent phosphoinositide-specific phospholipase C [Acidimicrobiia bacterium]
MTIRRAALVVVMVLVAASCAHLRGGGPGNEGLVVRVGVPAAAGARTVTVSAPRPETGLRATVWMDKPVGAAVASGLLPLTFTLPGDAVRPGVHSVVALAHSHSGTRFGVAFVDGSLRMNQVQVLGSHNSYHVAPTAPPWNGVAEWQYSHDPLNVQFQSEGIRQIELDVYADPNGIRVVHVPDADFGTTCSLWVQCLQVVKTWSDAHPKHMPITILTELNDTSYNLPTPILPWTGPAMDQLDAEIRSVFPAKDVITPDSVRGRHATLAEAVTTAGWPTIDSVRGKVMFVMDNGGSYRDTYTAGHPTLEHREIFTNSEVGRPDAAFIKLNDPIGDNATIRSVVAAGYVTRTRADADTHEARANNTVPRDAAIASGAQWVSTDYEVPGRAYGQPYFVSIPGGTPARCNPINAPSWCTSGEIESLAP